MKILKIIHGYPYRYNAGSEVYSQTLCHELIQQGHEVTVFTRQENGYKQEFSCEWETDPLCNKINVCLINMAHSRDCYQHREVDEAFKLLLDKVKPDVVHIGHLSHLSTALVEKIHQKNIPIIFTLHDFWLMCPRGQFLQTTQSTTEDLYPVCDSQDNEKCARLCYWRHFSQENDEMDIKHWTSWIGKRMDHVRDLCKYVDSFIAPSRYLMDRFLNDFSIEPSKMVYLDYGFCRERLQGRKRIREDDFVFGYIGTHKQAKGILHLLQAFNDVYANARLKIWGSPLSPFTQSLQSYVKTLGPEVESRIQWLGGYKNDTIVEEVFNHIDAIVVPSIWGENSPLVIHEALEAKVAVITADFGGMKEYVHHDVNGLLFEHRNPKKLAEQMQRFIDDPVLAETLVERGYLQSNDHHIPSIQKHTEQICSLYRVALNRRNGIYES
jgi:glycosyltransferase involved in cell wall biosynthesis